MKKFILILLIFASVWGFGQNSSLKKDILKITKGKKATVAVSVLNFEDGTSLHINGNKKLPMLSVFKFHIGLAVLNQVDEGKLRLDQKIFIPQADLHENTWSPIREQFPAGNIQMTLSEIIRYTVAESDNNGCDILIRLIGGTQAVQKFMDDKGVENFTIKANEAKMHEGYDFMYWNLTTTNSANRLLKDFYDNKIVSTTSTDFLMSTMIGTSTGQNKIVGQLPKSVPVAHKTGSSGKDQNGKTIAENDIGIVTLPSGQRYAISIFVSDSMEKNETNIQMTSDISKIVFDYFSSK